MKYLVLFSGGLDSSAALYTAVKKDPFGTFDLLHIQRRTNKSNQWIPQLHCAYQQYQYYRDKYPQAVFKFYSPVVSFNQLAIKHAEIFWYQGLAGVFTGRKNGHYKYIINGAVKDDDIEYSAETPEFGISDNVGRAEHWLTGREIYNAFRYVIQDKLPIMWRPVVNYTKRDCFAKLPEKIKNNVWSCCNPSITDNVYSPCGRCEACRVSLIKNDITISPIITAIVKTTKQEETLQCQLL